ncbi:MAG: preprotein translocase subunit YajC [Alphaproteobacteria bacterium]
MDPTLRTYMLFVSPAYAQAAAAPGAGSIIGQFLPLILIFGIMYFLLIRPQQKKMKELKAMIQAVRRGDEVITAGGIIGKVTKVNDENRVEIEIATGVKVQVVKSTITQVLSKTEPATA